MLAALLIVFREVFEAGLIVGIVLAATRSIAGRGAWIAAGIGVGVLGAAVLAVFAGALSDSFSGVGQEVFNAVVLSIAVIMLGWHIIWMARHGRQMAEQMKTMGAAVAIGARSLLALAVVVAVAVLREGAEVVLFLYGIAASANEGWATLLAGGALGILGGALVSFLLYRGLVAIPIGRLFRVTGWLIALMAAGMASQAVSFLVKASLVPSWGDELWDTSWLLSEGSLAGRALQALVGYSDRPMGVQLVAYLAVLAALLLGTRLARPAASATRPRVSARTAPP